MDPINIDKLLIDPVLHLEGVGSPNRDISVRIV